MMDKFFLMILICLLAASCNENESDSFPPWRAVFYVVNTTDQTVYAGNFENSLSSDLPRMTVALQVLPHATNIFWAIDFLDELYSNALLDFVPTMRAFGFCMYTSDVTNECSSNSYWDAGFVDYRLSIAADPTNQYLPPSLIYRMAITTNEILSNGKYAWEVPTNTRPFYIILTNNPVIVITSVMTNVTN